MNRASDTGLYDYGTTMRFYNVATGPGGVFADNTFASVVLTRNGSTKAVTRYVNGVQQIQFTDNSNLALVSSNVLHFLEDDLTTSGEQSAGLVNRIQIYNGELTAAEAAALTGLGTGNPIGGVPEPSTMGLLVSAIGAGLFVRRKR